MFVIVADSQPEFQQMLAQLMVEQGVDFHICSTGGEVIEAMKVRSVDLFVLTMDLPDIESASLCRYIRKTVKDKSIPVVMFADADCIYSFSDAFRDGATDVFQRHRIEYFSDYLSRLISSTQPLSGRVLVLDSSFTQRQLLQQVMSGWGLNVDTFETARVALRAHRQNCYDVILTEIELNDVVDGLEFVHDIRQLPGAIGDVPVVALTTYLSESTRVNFLTRGIDHCMLKPALLPELRTDLKHFIEQRRSRLGIEDQHRAELSKSKAKTEFLARMSHELRTSLNAIIGFSNLLIMGDDKDSETRECAGKINDAGKLLLELINEVLDLSHIESGNIRMNLESVNLGKVLDQCQQVMQSFANEHQLQLKVSKSLSDLYIRCDITRLTEVLLNLISNAIKYNRPGGTIEVSVELTQTGFVRINVADDGLGIAPEYAARIFEPFARAHADSHAVQGTGIGLTIALQLIELMGGRLDFVSTEGKGSKFWIDIPQSIQEETGSDPESAEHSLALMPCRVLYVDDNPVNCLLLEKWFEKQARATVIIAGSAKEALQSLADANPDVVITDIHMPEESGYWLLQKIRAEKNYQHLPVVALSAMAMDDEVEKGKLSGFSAYLTKPFDFQVLVTTLNTLVPIDRSSHRALASQQKLTD